MGNTINALKRNRKKYQEGGEVLSPEELMRQAGQEVMDMYAAEQDAKNNEVQPALLEQNQETPAGPPLGVPVVNAAPTSLLETPADPAPAAPAAPEAVAIQPFSPQNQSLENYIKETGAEVTSELLKQSIDYLNAVGSRGETFQRNKYQKENPELYYAAYPEERPFDGTETLSQFKERTGSSQVTAEMLQQRINLLDKNLDKRYRDAFKKEAKEQYPDAYAQAFPAEAAAEPIATADGVRPFSAENESLENYLRETGTELTAELIKQNIDYLVSTNSRGESYQREKFLKENPDLYYAAFPEERPFDGSETLKQFKERTGSPQVTAEMLQQRINLLDRNLDKRYVFNFKKEAKAQYPDAYYELFPNEEPIPVYDARNDLNEYLNQNQLDVNPELIKSRITYLESASPEAVANTKKDFLAAYPNVYFQAFPNEAPGNRQFNPGDSKPLINEPNYWIGKGENFNTLYSDPVKGPLLRENFNKDLLNWELAQGYRTLEAPLYSYEKGDEQPNPSFFTSIEDFNAAKYYYEKAGNKYKEPVKETTEQSYYTSIENPNNIDINSQVEQRDFNPSFGTLLPQKNLTEADFNPTGKGKFTFNKGDFPPIPAQYRNEEAYLQAVQSYNQVVSAEISDDTVERYSSALDVYESADNIENSMEWIMLKDTLFLNYPVFVTGALQSQTRKGDPKPTLATHRSLTPEDFLNTLREWEQNNAAPEELPETDEAEILRQQAIKEEEEKRAAELRQQAEENYVFEPEEVLKGLPLTDDGFIDVSEESLFSDEFAPYRNEVNYNKKIQNEMGWANFTADSPQPLPSDFASVNNYITASLKWNMVQQAKKDFGPDVVIAKSPSDVVYNEWGSVVVDETLGTAENPLPPTGTLADMPLWVSGDVYAKYRNPGEYNPLSTAGGNQYDNYKELVDNLAIWNLDEVAHYEKRVQEREQREINSQAARERREKNAQLQDNLLDPVTDGDDPVTDVDVPVDTGEDVDVPVTDGDDPVTDVDVPVDTGEDVDVPVTDVDVPVDTGGDSLLDQQPADSQYGPDDNWLGLDPIQALKASIGLPVEGIGEDFDRLNPSPEDQIRMDINGDGRVTSSDANWILLNYYESGILKDFVLGLSENDKEMLREPLAMVTDDVTEYGLSAEPPVDTGEDVDVPVDTGEDVDVPVDTGEDSLLEYQPPQYFKGDSPPSINQFRDPRLPADAFDKALNAYIEAQDFQLGDDRPVREDSLIDSVYDRILDAWYVAGNTDEPVDTGEGVDTPVDTGEGVDTSVDTVIPVLTPEIPTGVPADYQPPEYKYGDAPPAVPPAVSEEAYAINYAAWQAVQDAGPVDTDTDVDVPVDTDTDINPDDYDNDDDLIDAINDNLDSDVSQKPEGSTDVLRPMDESDIETTLSEISLDPNKIDNGEMSWGSAIDEADAFKEEYRVKATGLYNEYLPFISGEISDIPSALIPVENPGPNPHVEVFNDPYAYAEHQHKIANYKMYLYEQALYDNAVALYNERTGTTTSPEDTPEGTPQLDASDYSGEVSALEGIFSGKEYEGEMVLKYTPQLQDLYDKYTPYITGDTFSDIPPAMSQENPPPNPGTIYDESRYSTEELKSMLMQKAEYQLWEYEKELYDNAVAFYNERQGINPDDYDNDDDLIDAINDNIDSDGANQMSETTRTETSSNVTLEFKDAAGAPRELKYKNPLVTTPPSMSASDVDTGEDSKTTTADTAIQSVDTGDDVADATATGATATKIGDADTGLPALQGEIKTTDKVSGPGIDNTPTGGNYTASTIEPEEGEDPLSASAATFSDDDMAKTGFKAGATGPGAGSATAATFSEEALARTGLKATATGRTDTTLNAASVATAATAFDSVRNTKSFEALTGIAETRREAMEADPEYIEALDTLSGEELQAKLQDIPSVKSYLRAESTMLKMLENAGAKKIAEVEGPEVASDYTATTITPASLLQLTAIAQDRGVDIASLPQYDLLKQRQGVKLTQEEIDEIGGTAAKLLGDGELVPSIGGQIALKAKEVGVSADLNFLSSTGKKIEDLPKFGSLTKLDDVDMSGYEQAKIIGKALDETAIPELDLKGRTALIADSKLQGTAAEIGTVPTFQATTKQFATQALRETAAIEMITVISELPEDVAQQVSQDPASYDGATDTEEATKIASKIAALPAEALVSTQMETLIAGMETGEVPAWAKPAVAAIDARMAQRGLSASTVGRDALFNAIIQSALPIATANAQALQQRAAQNLTMEQQNAVTFAQNEMTLRMQNLANTQTAASQSAAMGQEMIVKNVVFEQQQIAQRNQEQQQINLQNIQNQQQVADQAAQFAQQNALAEFTEQSRQDYDLLKAKIDNVSTALNVDEQMRLKQYEAQINKHVANAQLDQDMEKANLNASLSYDLQRLTEQNAAAKDTMTIENQERLVELQTLLDFRKTNVAMSQQMDMANLTNNQQVEMAVLQNKAQVNSVNFTEENRLRLAELNAIIARQVRVAELNQRIGEVNLDASVKLELTELSEANATSRANMSVEQQTRLANLNTLVDFKKTQAQLTQQMELANLSNEQQVRIAVLSDRATADQQNFTEANRYELQRLTTAAQLLSSNEQLKLNADMARLSTEEKVALANLTAQNQFDATSMSAENTAELQRYEKQMAAAQVNAQLAQQMGLQELSNAQQTAMFNAQVNSNLDFKVFDAAQQVQLANSAFMQTMTMTEFNAGQQAAIQNATMLTQVNLAGADQATKLAVTNASNFLQMNMANLSNKQQVAVLNTQIEQQRLINNVSAKNAAAQFSAANQQQADLFMTNLGVEIEKYNASAAIAREQFNATEKNRQAAINAGNELEASRLTAQLKTDISKFNSQQDLAREQWNAANAQAVEQSNVQWRRQANLADTAAQNAANQQNAQIAFNLTSQEQTQLWQQMRDDAAYIRQSYENKEQRNAQLLATAIGNDTVTKNVATYNTLLGIED